MLRPEKTFQRRLIEWYDAHRRDLPWRPPLSGSGVPTSRAHTSRSLPRVDPYHVLVSEFMLQQTQVATVIPYFHRFMAKFPTVRDLAESEEHEVLRSWQGLGYYSRARNLQRAARQIVAEHGGAVPESVEALRSLPGVGRYTAGAISSIAFGRREPILDGNVTRVLCRLDRIEQNPREPAVLAALWKRAEQVLPESRVGDFNSALMELGATVCTPRAPQCLLCPVRAHCAAAAAGAQDSIPPAKKTRPSPMERRWTFCIRSRSSEDGNARWLIERRPSRGRWAGMWQFVTIQAGAETVPKLDDVGTRLPLRVTDVAPLGKVTHSLTHRRYEFDAFTCSAPDDAAALPHDPPRQWTTLANLDAYALPRPHLKIARMLAENG